MTIKQLKPRLENQRGLLLHCSALLSDCIFLTGALIPKYRSEKTIVLFLQKLSNYFHGILIIELLKLYNKNEYHSLWKILNLLKNNHENSNWESKINSDEISYLKNQLETNETKKIITNVKDIRNKQLAHLDSRIKDNKVFIHEIEYLINLGIATINVLLIRLFDTDMSKGFDSESESEYLFEISLEDFSKQIRLI